MTQKTANEREAERRRGIVETYRRIRGAKGHAAAERWRDGRFRWLSSEILRPATLARVKSSLWRYAGRYESLRPWEQRNIRSALEARVAVFRARK